MLTERSCRKLELRRALRCAKTLSEVEAAWRLVYDVYLERGIIESNPHRLHSTPPAISPDSCVVFGESGGRILSTMTLMRDGARGLPLDKVMDDRLDALRAQGRKLIEAGMLADRSSPMSDSRRRLFELMRWAAWFTVYQGADDIVIGVHPRHVGFYVRAFGMDVLSQTRSYPGLRGSPVVLLCCRATEQLSSCNPQRPGTAFVASHPLARHNFESRYRFPRDELRFLPWAGVPFHETLTAGWSSEGVPSARLA